MIEVHRKYYDDNKDDEAKSAFRDVFVMSGAEDLVAVVNNDGAQLVFDSWDGYRVLRYRPRTEGLFARIEK